MNRQYHSHKGRLFWRKLTNLCLGHYLKALTIIIEEDEPLKIQFGNVKCILTEHGVDVAHILQMKKVETELSSTRIQQKLLSKV